MPVPGSTETRRSGRPTFRAGRHFLDERHQYDCDRWPGMKKKILMAVTYYEPHVSGLTIYVQRISEELARRGHEVTVMTSRHRADLPREEEIRGVRVVRLPVLFRVSKGVVPHTLPIDAYRLVRKHDVVHMHLPLVGSP